MCVQRKILLSIRFRRIGLNGIVCSRLVCIYHDQGGSMQSVLCQLFAARKKSGKNKRVDLRAVTVFNILKVDIKCAVGRFSYDIHLSF